jgi:ribosomal protein S18 acetylase RimI-like enzyme
VTVRELTTEDVDVLLRFFDALPEQDATFVKEDVRDHAVVTRLADPASTSKAWVAESDGDVQGLAVIRPLHAWSSHVGELRLVVHPEARGQGLGRRLTQHALLRAPEMGIEKVLVEVIAEQESLLQMFSGLGFEGEAILRNQIRDRSDQMRDLVLLAYFVGDQWAAMTAAGIDGEFGS